jgi:transcription elongation factor GreA
VFSIFGAEESDVDKGWISFEAPLGKALIGKEVGDVVKVPLPTGAREYEVMEIFVVYEETVEVSDVAE